MLYTWRERGAAEIMHAWSVDGCSDVFGWMGCFPVPHAWCKQRQLKSGKNRGIIIPRVLLTAVYQVRNTGTRTAVVLVVARSTSRSLLDRISYDITALRQFD